MEGIEVKGSVKEGIHKEGVLKVNLLLWLTVGSIIIGFVVLFSMKNNMSNKLALIKTNMESDLKVQKGSTKSIIWWITGTTVWAVVCIILIVWWYLD